MKHSTNIRVYYEDTDAGGVVYHGSYLNFAERGRTEFLRHLGYQNSDIEKNYGMIFIVRKIDIDYLKPAVLDDLLRLDTSVAMIKNTSFVMDHSFFCHRRQDLLVCTMKVSLVCVNTENFKPVRMPEDFRNDFSKYLKKQE